MHHVKVELEVIGIILTMKDDTGAAVSITSEKTENQPQ